MKAGKLQGVRHLVVMEGPDRKYWNYRRADWRGFRKYVRKKISHNKLAILNPDAAAVYIDRVVSRGMDLYIPSRTGKISISSVPWFDDGCYSAMLAAQSGGPEEKQAYAETVQRKQVEHKVKIRNSLQNTSLNKRNFWKMAKTIQGAAADRTSRVPPMKNGTNLVTDNLQKCDGFAEAFIKKSQLPDGGEYKPRQGQFTDIPDFAFSREDVGKWLDKLDPTKAAGPNGISPRVYQKLSSALSNPLHTLYTRMIKLGQWPKQWRKSVICPIFKKKDPAVYTNYRPISLLDVPSKTLETQIARHMTRGICQNHYLPDEQYGFRAKHSCSDLAYTVIAQAMLTQDQRKPCYLLQTDIAGAFDRVDRQQLIQRLSEAGIKGKLHKLLEAYLTDRTFHVRLNGSQSHEYQMDNGVVQGSGMGPPMWNIFFSPVFDATQGCGLGFADDLNLATADQEQLARVKASTEEICKASRITMEPAKEVLTTLYPPRHPDKTEQPTTRLVGILVDQDANMKDHLNLVLKNARIAKCRLLRMRGYCNEHQLLAMYKTLIWSTIEQGSICYAHADNTSLEKLENFQNSTLNQLGLAHKQIDSLETRRKVGYSAMLYKQVVQGDGPSFIRSTFPVADPGPRAHLARTSTEKHAYQLTIPPAPKGKKHLQRVTDFCAPIQEWNKLPPSVFPEQPNILEFKRLVSVHYRGLAGQ